MYSNVNGNFTSVGVYLIKKKKGIKNEKKKMND